MKKIKLILIAISLVVLSGCEVTSDMISTRYYKFLYELEYLTCEEYKETALCEIYAFMYNKGHLKVSYERIEDEGKITLLTVFGVNISKKFPLRCGIEPQIAELIEEDREAGFFWRSISVSARVK